MGQGAGGPLPAFTACKLWAVGDQEGACLLLRSRGGGRDSSSAGVESIYAQVREDLCVCVYGRGCTKGCWLGSP